MISSKLSYFALPLCALALTGYVATAAVAEEAMMAKPAIEAGKDGGKGGKGEWRKGGKRGGMLMTAEELDKVEGLPSKERDAYFKQRHEELNKLSEEEKEAKFAERRKAFDALSDEDKKSIRARNDKFYKTLKAEKKKEMEDFLNTLTPEQRAKWDAMQKDKHHGWGGKDGKRSHKGGKDKNADNAGEPEQSDKAE